jgi:hypothetical protein
MYIDRSKAKKQMLKLEQEYEHIKQEIKIRSLKSNPNV